MRSVWHGPDPDRKGRVVALFVHGLFRTPGIESAMVIALLHVIQQQIAPHNLAAHRAIIIIHATAAPHHANGHHSQCHDRISRDLQVLSTYVSLPTFLPASLSTGIGATWAEWHG